MVDHKLTLLILFSVSSWQATAKSEDLESQQRRTYGTYSVTPIKEGHFPPVCVRKAAIGSFAKVRQERDENSPWIAVFCKGVDNETPLVFSALCTASLFSGIPCSITITPEKGILPTTVSDSTTYEKEHFFAPDEGQKKLNELRRLADEYALTDLTIGLAVNRHWRDGIGYLEGHDTIVAYVRGKVLAVFQLDTTSMTRESINELISKIGAVERGEPISQN